MDMNDASEEFELAAMLYVQNDHPKCWFNVTDSIVPISVCSEILRNASLSLKLFYYML
jgi:hypothetical protein